MVVDSSALVAIMLLEPEAPRFVRAIAEARRRLVSAANLLEAGTVIERRRGIEAGEDLDAFVGEVGLEIEPVTVVQVRIARAAYRSYGRGNHPAVSISATASPMRSPRRRGCPYSSRATISVGPTSRRTEEVVMQGARAWPAGPLAKARGPAMSAPCD